MPNMRVSYVVIIGLVGRVGGACLGVSHTEETVRLVGGYAGFLSQSERRLLYICEKSWCGC